MRKQERRAIRRREATLRALSSADPPPVRVARLKIDEEWISPLAAPIQCSNCRRTVRTETIFWLQLNGLFRTPAFVAPFSQPSLGPAATTAEYAQRRRIVRRLVPKCCQFCRSRLDWKRFWKYAPMYWSQAIRRHVSQLRRLVQQEAEAEARASFASQMETLADLGEL